MGPATTVCVAFCFRVVLVLCFARQLRAGRHFKKWEQRCSGLDCPKQALAERLGKKGVGMQGVLQLGEAQLGKGLLGRGCRGKPGRELH